MTCKGICDLVPDSDNVSTIMWVLATPKIFQTLMGKIWRERGGGWGLPYTWLKQFYLPRYRNLNSLQRKEKFCFEKTKKKSEYTLVTSTNFPWRTMWNNLNIVCTSKGNHQQDKKPTEWEKIFANDVTNKGLISKICKQLMHFNINKQPHQKMERKAINQ